MGEYIKKVLENTKDSLLQTKSILTEERRAIIDRLNKCDMNLIEVDYKLSQVKKELENR